MGDNDARAYDNALYNSLEYEDGVDFDVFDYKSAYNLDRPNVDSETVAKAMEEYKKEAVDKKKKQEEIDNGKCDKK